MRSEVQMSPIDVPPKFDQALQSLVREILERVAETPVAFDFSLLVGPHLKQDLSGNQMLLLLLAASMPQGLIRVMRVGGHYDLMYQPPSQSSCVRLLDAPLSARREFLEKSADFVAALEEHLQKHEESFEPALSSGANALMQLRQRKNKT
jgi:hypothetical protein